MKIESCKNKQDIKNTINVILKRSFLIRDRDRDREYFFVAQDNIETINEYLDVIGFKIVLNRDMGVIALEYLGSEGIVPPVYKMSVNEMKVFVAISKIFDKKVYDELISTDSVKANLKELRIMLESLDLKLTPNNKITTFQNVLDNLERFSLIEIPDKIVKDEYSEFQILPSIKFAMKKNEFFEYFNRYEKEFVNGIVVDDAEKTIEKESN